MERRAFGNTGLQVPVIGMGTWKTFDVYGKEVDARVRLVDEAVDAGTSFFDSSPMYGQAEQVLGQTLNGRRDRAIVATKVWTSDDEEAEQQIANALSYYDGRVDVYQVHNIVSWRKRLTQLQQLKDAGAVSVIGVTHYSSSAYYDLLHSILDPLVRAVQIPYNPAQRTVESKILPAAADLGLGVIIMRPFGEGTLLSAKVSRESLAPLAPFGISTWPQALLKWILSDPRCHVAIPATSSGAHVRANAAAGEPPWLGADERAYISRLAGHPS